MKPLAVSIDNGRVSVGARFSVSFQRTLRIPDDGRTYPLPPGLGLFPVESVASYADRAPESWRRDGGVFIPMYQREALWLGFDGASWKPNAVKVGVGRINAVTGDAWSQELHASPQDYIVCPDQPWLDGIKVGPQTIRQFVALPLGSGNTIEGQLTGREEVGGIQLVVFEPKPGRFPDVPPPPVDHVMEARTMSFGVMGIGAGGRMKQKIYPDRYGLDVWDETRFAALTVHIVNSEDYRALTGSNPPPTPVTAKQYTDHGLPWFDLYDEEAGDLPAADRLVSVKSVGETAGERDEPVEIDERRIRKLTPNEEGRPRSTKEV
jgi:hypothetical protein